MRAETASVGSKGDMGDDKYRAAAAVYRPDLYDAATGETHRYPGETAVAMKIDSGFEEHNPKVHLATIGR
jgi:hypothetical protein